MNMTTDQLEAAVGYARGSLPGGAPVSGERRNALRQWARECGVSRDVSTSLPAHALRALWNSDSPTLDAEALEREHANRPVSAPAPDDAAAALASAVRALAGGAVDEDKVRELALEVARTEADAVEDRLSARIAEAVAAAPARRLEITINGQPTATVEGPRHRAFPTVLQWLASGDNVMLIGPAGSGKTTMAEQCATALGVPFAFNGAINSEYKLSGFIDAQGRIIAPPFRKVFEGGGVYCFDEIDASAPGAVLAFNAALSNGMYDFPDATVQRHPKAYFLASANTYGNGADRQYVGRTQLDAASLDRFARVAIDYDEDLERALCPDADWCGYVQRVRAACRKLGVRQVVSPRASIAGARALAAGVAREAVEAARLFAGLDADTVSKIRAEARS